jgi:hypothetical protein
MTVDQKSCILKHGSFGANARYVCNRVVTNLPSYALNNLINFFFFVEEGMVVGNVFILSRNVREHCVKEI